MAAAAAAAAEGVDDLDNLIADSLGGVQTALEGERKAAPPATQPAEGARGANEAVRELQQGPARVGEGEGGIDSQALFENLVRSFQDEAFQKAMADALQGAQAGEASSSSSAEPRAAAAEQPCEDFLKQFFSSFDKAVSDDENFEKSLTNMMTSMLSKDLVCEPLKQIADAMEPWLKSQKGLAPVERARFEAQLRLYRQILEVYRQSPDPLPEPARAEVQRLLQELQLLGQPPEEVMRQVAPKDAEDGEESFEDFIKAMNLDQGIGAAEQELIKKLAEDPEELTNLMKTMAGGGLPGGDDEGCKQQ